MDEREQRIRERAYRIWEEEGRPQGRAEAHWEKARELEAQADGPAIASKPNPVARGEEHAAHRRPVEPPESLENQGEFPVRTDRGEQSPKAPHYPKDRGRGGKA